MRLEPSAIQPPVMALPGKLIGPILSRHECSQMEGRYACHPCRPVHTEVLSRTERGRHASVSLENGENR
jgi:hypothetical protein